MNTRERNGCHAPLLSNYSSTSKCLLASATLRLSGIVLSILTLLHMHDVPHLQWSTSSQTTSKAEVYGGYMSKPSTYLLHSPPYFANYCEILSFLSNVYSDIGIRTVVNFGQEI